MGQRVLDYVFAASEDAYEKIWRAPKGAMQEAARAEYDRLFAVDCATAVQEHAALISRTWEGGQGKLVVLYDPHFPKPHLPRLARVVALDGDPVGDLVEWGEAAFISPFAPTANGRAPSELKCWCPAYAEADAVSASAVERAALFAAIRPQVQAGAQISIPDIERLFGPFAIVAGEVWYRAEDTRCREAVRVGQVRLPNALWAIVVQFVPEDRESWHSIVGVTDAWVGVRPLTWEWACTIDGAHRDPTDAEAAFVAEIYADLRPYDD